MYISWLGGSSSSWLTDSLFKTVSWFPLIHWSLMGPICNVYTIVETMVETPAHDKLYLRDTSSSSAVCLMVLLQLSKYFPQLSSRLFYQKRLGTFGQLTTARRQIMKEPPASCCHHNTFPFTRCWVHNCVLAPVCLTTRNTTGCPRTT